MRVPAIPRSFFSSSSKLANWDDLVKSRAAREQWRDVLLRYRRTKNSSLLADPAIVPAALKACASLHSVQHGVSLHADVIKLGFEASTSANNTLMSFYIKCVAMDSASKVFDDMPQKDSVSWNVIIHGFLSPGDVPETGLSFFKRARASGFVPNASTLVLVIQACWKLDDVCEGLNTHGLVVRNGHLADVSVQNSLLTMYAKGGDMDSAQQLFNEISQRDVITWSALIGGYAQSDRAIFALQLFREMSSDGNTDTDGLTAVSVLKSCSTLGDIYQGRTFHAHLVRRGFTGDLFVENSLVDMYSKCHDLDSAYIVFKLIPQMNTVSWNSMISGLVHNEKHREALELFDSMKQAGVESDEVTLVNLLQSCKRLGQAVWCKCIHSVIIKKQLLSNSLVSNSLLDAYAKCELMEFAMRLFQRMTSRNVISWSIIIAGFVHSCEPDTAISFFKEMWLAREKPNSVTILSLLEACASSADLKLAMCAHGITIRNELLNELSIGTTVLDMYAKCGDLNASRKVFERMSERNVLSWNAMIGALGMNGRAKEALNLFLEMQEENVKPNEVTILSVLSACSHGGLVEEGLSIFQGMTRDPLLKPSVEHYSCVVDMLGRAGNLDGALEVIKSMPEGLDATPAAWGALLSACRSYGNCELGKGAASHVIDLEPSNSAGYLLISSVHAKGGFMGEMARMRILMKKKGLKVISGYSLVHVDQKSHKFVSWDVSHPQSKDIYFTVNLLHFHMKRAGKNDCPIT